MDVRLIGVVVVLTSLVLPEIAISVFRIPTEMQAATRWAIRATGTSFAITLTIGVFGGVLAALHRFDLISGVTIGQTVLRTAGVYWLLKSGYGIVGLAVWELIVVVIANIGTRPSLLKNFGAKHNWLLVQCAGTTANRDAIGARVHFFECLFSRGAHQRLIMTIDDQPVGGPCGGPAQSHQV